MKKLLISAIVIAALYSCKKNITPFEVDLSQITERDTLGNLTGTIDNSDWKLDNNLVQAEYDLFKGTSSSLYDFRDSCYEKSSNIEIYAYGNPVKTGSILLGFKVDKKTSVSIRIVDKNLRIVDAFGGLLPIKQANINYGIRLNTLGQYPKGLYRIYYAFYSKDNGLYAMGHGDIKIL